ncbi:MAG: signal transduction histidine kinase [Parcubacteria group bacterium Athens0416_74]|nr:MAG: signal transduction histidine kinase [Parcubacteria group bacterium Athens0416_74]
MNKREGKDPLGDPQDGHPLTLAIIDTIREPLIVLSDDLRVVVASRAFYKKFNLTYENTRGKSFYDLGEGQWNIPAFRTLLEDIVPKRTTIEEYEVVHDFPNLGFRTLRVNAREIKYKNSRKGILLSILDITEERAIEMHKATLMRQKDTLLKEMRHRIANSLQLIASIILLKAGSVQSEESRLHLEDAHDRILSIATVQRNLDPTGDGHAVPVVEYLTTLCESIARSMIGGRKPIILTVNGSSGTVEPDDAIGLGLLTTELVINALKHAFPGGEGTVVVTFEATERGWLLSIRDDGTGMDAAGANHSEGLGTSIVDSLAKQLNASVRRESSSKGTCVTISHSSKTPATTH